MRLVESISTSITTAVLVISIMVLALSGCAGLDFENRPNNSSAYLSDQINTFGKQVELAQSRNQISEEKGDKLLDDLIDAQRVLKGTLSAYTDLELCQSSTDRLECVDAILETVERGLQ